MSEPIQDRFWGYLVEFDNVDSAVDAAQSVYDEGYRQIDAYSPYPVEELSEAIGFHKTKLPMIVLAAGIIGAIVGFGLQYWVSVIEYPINVAGRPMNSWPQFIPITFEMTILFAAFTAVLAMLALNGLPRPHHPVFNAPNFKLASRDRFFVAIKGDDPIFDRAGTRTFLEGLGGKLVEVEDE